MLNIKDTIFNQEKVLGVQFYLYIFYKIYLQIWTCNGYKIESQDHDVWQEGTVYFVFFTKDQIYVLLIYLGFLEHRVSDTDNQELVFFTGTRNMDETK